MIAVSALGEAPDDRVDDRFGRARFLQFYSDEGTLLKAVENTTNRNAMQGAGIATAELVTQEGARVVITGHLGPKAFTALSAAGAVGYAGSGMSVREAVDGYLAGTLDSLDEAGPAHAGM